MLMQDLYSLFRRAEAERQLDGEEDLFDTPEAEATLGAVEGGAAEEPKAPEALEGPVI